MTAVSLSDMKVSTAELNAKVAQLYGKPRAEPSDCTYCKGDGGEWIALFGDPNLGYSHFEHCLKCGGTGKHVIRHSKYEDRLPLKTGREAL